MAKRVIIPMALSLVMLAYVSGLAMHLHLAWEHGGQGAVACSKGATEYRCSHGHVHVKRDTGSAESSAKSPSNQPAQPDTPTQLPGPDDDCPTCVELAGFAAGLGLVPACSAFILSLSQQPGIDAEQFIPVAFTSHHFSRGPPFLVI